MKLKNKSLKKDNRKYNIRETDVVINGAIMVLSLKKIIVYSVHVHSLWSLWNNSGSSEEIHFGKLCMEVCSLLQQKTSILEKTSAQMVKCSIQCSLVNEKEDYSLP